MKQQSSKQFDITEIFDFLRDQPTNQMRILRKTSLKKMSRHSVLQVHLHSTVSRQMICLLELNLLQTRWWHFFHCDLYLGGLKDKKREKTGL